MPSNDSQRAEINIPGLDYKQGLAMTGNQIEFFKKILILYCKDAEERLPFFQSPPELETLTIIATQVHALKSASASIGAKELSIQAIELETAAKAKNLSLVQEKVPAFAGKLAELIKNIRSALETADDENNTEKQAISEDLSLFHELMGVLKSQDAAEIDRIIEELFIKVKDQKTIEALDQISDEVLITEYDNAIKIIEGLLNTDS